MPSASARPPTTLADAETVGFAEEVSDADTVGAVFAGAV